MPRMLKCSICGKEKPFYEFASAAYEHNKLVRAVCRECDKIPYVPVPGGPILDSKGAKVGEMRVA